MFFLDATIGNAFFGLFSTIAMVSANDDRRRLFAQDKLVKRDKKGLEGTQNLNYYFLLEHQFNHCF